MKSFPAELAHKRLVSRVDARVRVERGAAVERFAALVTLVRFFLGIKRASQFNIDLIFKIFIYLYFSG